MMNGRWLGCSFCWSDCFQFIEPYYEPFFFQLANGCKVTLRGVFLLVEREKDTKLKKTLFFPEYVFLKLLTSVIIEFNLSGPLNK